MNISPDVISFVVKLFCVSTMLAMGLSVSIDDVLKPFRNKLALAIIVLVNNVLVPLIGLVIVILLTALQGTPLQTVAEAIFPLTDGQKIGFLLLLMASGALLGPVFAEIAKLSADLARGIMVTSAGVTTLSIPLLLMLVAPATDTSLQAGPVFLTLLVYQLLPLVLGIFVKGKYNKIGAWVRPIFMQLTTLSFLLLTAMVLMSNLAPLDFTGALPTQPVKRGSIFVQEPVKEETIVAALSPEMRQTYAGVSPMVETIILSGWIVVDPGVTYYVANETSTLTVTSTRDFSTTIAFDNEESLKAQLGALSDGQIPLRLRADLIVNGVDLPVVSQSTQLSNGNWILTNAHSSYFLAQVKGEQGQGTITLAVHQKIPSPAAFVNQLLTALTSLPDVGPLLAVLSDVVVVLVPYAVFTAIVALLLTVGTATGSIINNMVKSDLPDPPRVVAVSTAVRNVSAALIVAVEHLSLPQEVIGFIVIFYVISLILVGVQVSVWANEVSTARVDEETVASVPT